MATYAAIVILNWIQHTFWTPNKSQKHILEEFTDLDFPEMLQDIKVEEEDLPYFEVGGYYPIDIGEVFASRYAIVGKLGFGTYSTVWLARDLKEGGHVALKVLVRSECAGYDTTNEIQAYERLAKGDDQHPGKQFIRAALDHFTISGPNGEHPVIVHAPLWEDMAHFRGRNQAAKFPTRLLRLYLAILLLALNYLHDECQVIHTDIKEANVLFDIYGEKEVFEEFENAEKANPSPRKTHKNGNVYVSRPLGKPKEYGFPVLCDFDQAVPGDYEHHEVVQPDCYRAPEVILGQPWSYGIDIWNLGCLIWDMFQGRSLFSGVDENRGGDQERKHLAEIVSLLGPPPLDFCQKGMEASQFFDKRGELSDKTFRPWLALLTLHIGNLKNYPGEMEPLYPMPAQVPLEEQVSGLDGEERIQFLCFMKKMLQWRPEDRKTAAELLEDAWLNAREVLEI